ncbi:MAG: ATP-dependent sacrificial sulfur transferase LarE [Verrucomicrobiae bacterium]|nr:ATP-dependent sacrificial sulfur transferase LarE [Verrucomicrobiae bacterium]
MSEAEELLGRLEAWFNPVEGSLTAFSGGVDSALVLFLSHRFLGEKGIGVIADSPSLKRRDLNLARDFCSQFGISLRVIQTGELENPNYASNPNNRCFFCKDTLYRKMEAIHHEYPGFYLLNGTNRDDHGDYRPGLQAASNHGIHSPLSDCGIGKAQVRLLAKHFGLPVWNKPASPCLSSRIPYGQDVTEEKLAQIEAAETFLNELGFDEVRVRHFGEEARIEVPATVVERLIPLKSEIQTRFTEIGFTTATIDAEGLVSGKLNRAIVSHG